MKFKKVEIQAFRAYDKVDDGTFDFTRIEDGENADFISLYAPNGFGKTSFYDAVEYGVTKNIHRFIKKQKFNQDTAKSEKSISSVNKQYILRNRYSDASLESFVKLTTTKNGDPLIRKISSPIKGGRDFKFDSKETVNKHFKEVILSQEWIDAFLKEDKPEERYETFIEYFGDKKIDEYYKKLTNLIALNDKRIEILSKELNGIQLELKFDGDRDILKKINDKINSLNKSGEQIKEIDESYSENDSLNLSNTISERTSDIDFEIIKVKEQIKYLDIFYSGNDENEGMTKYFESREKIKQFDKQIKENNSILDKFEKLQKCLTEVTSIKKQNDELGTKKQQLQSLEKDFVEYTRIKKEISEKNQENKKLKGELSSILNRLNELRLNESESSTKQSSIQKHISEIEKIISEIPNLKENYSSTNFKLKESQEGLSEIENKISNYEKEKSLLDYPINNFKTVIQEISTGVYPSVLDEMYTNNKKIIDELTQIENSTNNEKNILNEINSKIQANENLQKEVEQFISKGAEIVNKRQTSSCPLCEQQYDSFSELASKISNNKLLSNVLSALFIERDNKNKIINQLNESLRLKREELKNLVTQQLEELEKKRNTISNDLKKISVLKSQTIKDIELYNKYLNDINLKLNGKSFEVFEQESKNLLIKFKSEFDSLVKQNKEVKELISSELIKSETIKEKSAQVIAEIDRLNKETSYLKIIDYFRINFPQVDINSKALSNEIDQLTDRLKNLSVKEVKLKAEIDELKLTLNSFTIENVKKQSEVIEKTKDLLTKVINSFEQEVKSKLNIELEEFNIESFSKLLNERKKVLIEKTKKFELIIKDYNLLSKLKENVAPYLKYEKAKIRDKDIRKRIEFLKTKVANGLNSELNNVADYLAEQIDSFFYEGLINDLYRKIDPHPDYKTVTFKCDFSDTKPKLNVCVFHDKQDELIIPNLYFSTAQLNILSLSIFLAKALNAKDDTDSPIECIFIDDPIQSMDSINILSTIDLIRSIVVNHKKQIVLSTHDENFHNLLKKKIPSNLFNSKFMELETFGKVKQDIN